MLSFGEWEQGAQNLITFVLVDSDGVEVSGLGTGFTLEVSKNGGAFVASAGTKAEISDGWYSYLCTAGESDTPGPVSIRITHASIIQQNLEYVVLTRAIYSIAFTYTVTNSVTLAAIEGVQVWISLSSDGSSPIWSGTTDAFGVARDLNGNLPRLDPGTYYFFRQKTGFTFDDPDTEVVS